MGVGAAFRLVGRLAIVSFLSIRLRTFAGASLVAIYHSYAVVVGLVPCFVVCRLGWR